MDAYTYLIMAFSIIWLGIFGFTWFLNSKADHLSQEMTLLKEQINNKK